ncbi:hypothetical protein NXX50_02890 [Bacteroides fragilis]|nr:hypothetical protein [Bacteroides fragilis]
MPINYNQLLKSLEIGSDHFKVFICFLCSTLVLYPLLFVSLPFLRDISIYQQLLFVSGCSVIYTGLGILFSAPAIKYPGMFYLPILVLGCISVVFYIKKVLQSSDSMLIMLLILLISTYSCLFVGGIIAVVVKTKKSKKSKPIPKKKYPINIFHSGVFLLNIITTNATNTRHITIIRKSPYSLFMKSMILLINSSIVYFLFLVVVYFSGSGPLPGTFSSPSTDAFSSLLCPDCSWREA